ncbi:hypothetical protein HPB50_022226 [Hyalomma asiaticum]|uniref:Uncharacterized protein n=1 Tax=Hyalomma asiaticum TaxID=266040 RepID=A0ACB7RYR3_HYAAI|nr:hypothetical protein HPB50_022226 [Hyalomma asiaticum]
MARAALGARGRAECVRQVGCPRRRILLKPGAYIPIMLEQHRAAEASFAYTRNPKPVVVTFRELPNLVPNTSTADWVQGFQIPLALEPELNEDDEIAVSHIDLLKVIVELLAKYDDQKLSKHITWLLVQYYAPMASYSLLVAKYADERKAKANLRMFRVLTVALSVVSRIAPADRHIIDDGYDGLLAAALDRVTVSNWMDEASKMSVSEKLKAVKREIWPPDAKAGSLVEFWVNNSDALHQVDKTQAYLETTRLRWNNLPGGSGNVRLREDLSEDKVYFMTLCYMFCESTGHLNPLAPDCNKVARNSASFAKAFGCPPNSPMNPEKKCPFFNGNSL